MKASELLHGDVLCYTHKNNPSFIQRCIRLIEGNQIIHCSIVRKVDGKMFILEALNERIHSYVPFYTVEPNEEICCFRPSFSIPQVEESIYFKREPYGYACILDSLFNHTLSLVTHKRWKFRPMFNSKYLDCSALVAKMLDLENNTNWCDSYLIVEPDDFATHPEHFTYMGVVEWL